MRNGTKRNVTIFDRVRSRSFVDRERGRREKGRRKVKETGVFSDPRGSFDATRCASLPVFSRSIAVTDCGNVYKARVTRRREGGNRARSSQTAITFTTNFYYELECSEWAECALCFNNCSCTRNGALYRRRGVTRYNNGAFPRRSAEGRGRLTPPPVDIRFHHHQGRSR